jgi:hypothetical protein
VTDSEKLFIPNNLPQLRSDLAPLYNLKPADYNQIVNELTNLLAVASHLLQVAGNEALAQALVHSATEILCDYDPDVVEFLQHSLMQVSQPADNS